MDSALEDIVALLKRALALKELPRIGWILEGARRDDSDSVAAHSYMVVLISLLLAKQLEGTFGPFDIAKVLSMATLHDLAESVTGDLDSGLKRRMAAKGRSKAILEELEQDALSSLTGDICGNESLLDMLREFDEGTTKEAKLVKFADVLDAFAHAHDRLGKVFEAYLEHSKEQLKRHGPDTDGRLGVRLSEWIDLVVARWASIAPKALE